MSIAAYISGGIGPGSSVLFFTTRGLSIGVPPVSPVGVGAAAADKVTILRDTRDTITIRKPDRVTVR